MHTHVLDAQNVEAVLMSANEAPSLLDRQSWRWRWRLRDDTLHLHSDPNAHLYSCDSSCRDLALSCGASLNHCVAAAGARQWNTRVHRLPNPTDADHLAAVEIVAPTSNRADNAAPKVTTPPRVLNRRPYRPTRNPAADIALLGTRADRFGVKVHQFGHHDAPSEVAGQQVLDHEIAAAVLALGTQTDDLLAWLRAGETISALVLAGSALGLTVGMTTTPLKTAQIRDRAFADIGHPQVLLRLGWPHPGVDTTTPKTQFEVVEPSDRSPSRGAPETSRPQPAGAPSVQAGRSYNPGFSLAASVGHADRADNARRSLDNFLFPLNDK